MVDINLTIVVQLVLFLGFLWGANAIAFRPMLRAMDSRADKVAEDKQTAEENSKAASELTAHVQREINDARRRLGDEYRKARRATQETLDQTLAERRRRADDELQALRNEIEEAIAHERQSFDQIEPELVATLDRVVGGGTRP